MKKKVPTGVCDFKLMIEGGYSYVDKTLLIQEVVEQGLNEVMLIPRPRRFGKTLNLSMLQYFFEKSEEDTSYLFQPLNIWKLEKYRAMQGAYPVIFLSLKDVKHASWQLAREGLSRLIAKEYVRHRYLLEGDLLSQPEKDDFCSVFNKTENQPLLEESLLLLSEWLHRYHKRRVILLIDEYDTPVHASYTGGYYEIFISFLRNWFSAALKGNKFLEFAVLTGILRIAKESIFSGLNNINSFTILHENFDDKFGLTESEVLHLLNEHDLVENLSEIRAWYDGYRIGSCDEIYNPWSVLKCVKAKGVMAPYWVHSSDNAILSELITQGTEELKADIEELLKGGVIEKNIDDGIVFSDLDHNPDAIWSLLLYSGYVTTAATPIYGTRCLLKIPNVEVLELFRALIINWFKKSIAEENYVRLLKSLTQGDVKTFTLLFEEFVLSTFSIFDVTQSQPERVYHAFVLGMLVGLEGRYEVKSNRESGYGRYDVLLIPKHPEELGIIIEFKKVKPGSKISVESAAKAALLQIEEKQYAVELFGRGIKNILCLGIAFEGKKIHVCSQGV